MVNMNTIRAKAIERLENEGCEIIQEYGDFVIYSKDEVIAVCRIKYVVGEYDDSPTRKECENMMIQTLMDTNFDIPVNTQLHFDEIQILDLGNGHGILRHHINAAVSEKYLEQECRLRSAPLEWR